MQLNPDTFTLVDLTVESIVQFLGGMCSCAPSESPSKFEITTHQPGDLIITATSFYARGVGHLSIRPA